MEYLFVTGILMLMVAVCAFQAGQWSKEHPSEEEMIRMIVEARTRKRIREEVEFAIKEEISARAAGLRS